MNVKDLKTKTKIVIVSAGVLGLAGLGIGAANAATFAPSPVTTQSISQDTPTPGDTADTPGTVETATAGDAADTPDAAEGTEKAGAPEAPGDTGPNVEQTGEHTDPGDAPGTP